MPTTPGSISPEDEPLEEVDLPGFNPTRRNRPDPPMPGATATSSTIDESDLSDEELFNELPDGDPYEPLGPSNRTTSSRGSTEADPVVAEAFGQLAALGVTMAGLFLNRAVGRGNGAWLTHDDEATAIALPLGRIAARHAPIGGDAAGDVADGIEAGFAAAQYGMRASVDHARANTVDPREDPQ